VVRLLALLVATLKAVNTVLFGFIARSHLSHGAFMASRSIIKFGSELGDAGKGIQQLSGEFSTDFVGGNADRLTHAV
jgi:hypothetical protein